MNVTCEYLLPFKKYAKLFVLKIHPDRHHGYTDIQKINAHTTHIVNNLFKFEDDSREYRHEVVCLPFFIWKTDKNGHVEQSYKLTFNRPFDIISGKSALGLFKSAHIPVDFSILDSFPKGQAIQYKKNEIYSSDLSESIRNSCLDLNFDDSYLDVSEVLHFIRQRPYIQFDGIVSDDKRKVFKLCTYLVHVLSRLENKIGPKMPIIIISDTYIYPQFDNGIVRLPLYSSLQGINYLSDFQRFYIDSFA